MRPQYWMPCHVRACLTPTGAIVLDLLRNRYFGIGMREARALSALALNWFESSTCVGAPPEPLPLADAINLVGPLSAAGFLSSRLPERPRFERPASVERAIEPLPLLGVGSDPRPLPAIRMSHAVNFIGACVWAKYAVRARRLYSIASEVSSRRVDAAQQADLQRTIELVSVFRNLRPYAFAAQDQCLFHALALLKFLSCYGKVPIWVIAVRARPWSAHSWLQLGSRVLDGDPEELNGFTPILTV